MRTLWLALFAIGCGSAGPAQDVAAYEAVVSNPEVMPTEGLAACTAIQDPGMAGDCALFVVTVEARRPAGRPENWCEQVPAGVWQDECWFITGESHRFKGNTQAAVHGCLASGNFKNDCAQHLWQTQVFGLIRGRGPQAYGEQLEAAERLYRKWDGLVGAQTDFRTRFWARYFAGGFEGMGGVDLRWCEPLAEPHQERCVAAGTEVYARDLAPLLERSGVDLCAWPEPPTTADLERWIPTVDHPRLNAVLQQRHASLCGA